MSTIRYQYCLSDGRGRNDKSALGAEWCELSLAQSLTPHTDDLIVSFSKRCEATLSPLACDLLDIGRGLFLIDTRSPRRRSRKHGMLRRLIEVVIPVREIRAWQTPVVTELLQQAIQTVSGDHWRLHFIPWCGWRQCHQPPLPVNTARRVCLLSEGLFSVLPAGSGGSAQAPNAAPSARS